MRDADAILVGWYEGEIGGEALFIAQAGVSEPRAARKWQTLVRVEATVAAKLKAVLASRGVAVPLPQDVQRRAQERLGAVAGKSWRENMQWLRDLAARALLDMRTEAARLPPELEFIGKLVVDHETALLAFAEREIEGDEAQSRQCIERFLSESA